MSWPEHPFVSAFMVVQFPEERDGAARAIECFSSQSWPVKQLVIVNATDEPLTRAQSSVMEIWSELFSLGRLKNKALESATGEWCCPWYPDSWYDPEYVAFHMDGADAASPMVIRNPYIEYRSLALTDAAHAPFYSFFRLGRLPRYDDTGSESAFLDRLPKARIVAQRRVLAKRYVSASDFKHMATQLIRPKVTNLKDAVCVVQLGRYGDLINILPLLLWIYNNYGKPYVMVSREFVGLFDGISYAEPFPVDFKDNQVLPAMALAKSTFKHVIQTQIWGEGYEQDKQTNAYNRESWRMGGILGQFENKAWRPLFDQETPEWALEGDELCDGRPLILTNLTQGQSSPFDQGAQVLKTLKALFGVQYQVFDVGQCQFKRLQYLLPLIRRAAVVVSLDTSLLHLAAATNTPVVALLNHQPWLGTICRCCVVRAYTYSEAAANHELVSSAVTEALQSKRVALPPQLVPSKPPFRKIFHIVACGDELDEATIKRKKWAKDSWEVFYERGAIPVPTTNLARWGQHIGSSGRLPYFKDVLAPALAQAGPDDIICYTNDDIILHPDLPEQLRFYCGIYGVVASRRCEIALAPPPALEATPEEWVLAARNEMFRHEGRDLFAFTKRWIVSKLDQLPDFLVGATDWDNCMVIMMRYECGIVSNTKNMAKLTWPTEMPLGWTSHIRHRSTWQNPSNFHDSEANKYNRRLFKQWAEIHASHLMFADDNQLTS